MLCTGPLANDSVARNVQFEVLQKIRKNEVLYQSVARFEQKFNWKIRIMLDAPPKKSKVEPRTTGI